jgi:hypothetical protein
MSRCMSFGNITFVDGTAAKCNTCGAHLCSSVSGGFDYGEADEIGAGRGLSWRRKCRISQNSR